MDERLGHPVGEVVFLRIARQIRQRQHGERADLRGLRPRRRGGGWRPPQRMCRIVEVNGLERGAHLAAARVAPARFLDEAPRDDAAQACRDPRRRRRGRVAQDGRHQLGMRRGSKWQGPSRHFVEHDAERPEIAASVAGLAFQGLRSHVSERAGHHRMIGGRRPRLRVAFEQFRWLPHRQAEIQHLDRPVGRDQDVVRLQIAVNDAAVVSVRQRVGNLDAVADRRLGGQPVRGNEIEQRAPFHVLHRDERLRTLFADLVDGADVRVVQDRCRTRLVQQQVAPLFVALEIAQQLDGNGSLQPRVERPIDDAHAAGAEMLDDLGTSEGACRESAARERSSVECRSDRRNLAGG